MSAEEYGAVAKLGCGNSVTWDASSGSVETVEWKHSYYPVHGAPPQPCTVTDAEKAAVKAKAEALALAECLEDVTGNFTCPELCPDQTSACAQVVTSNGCAVTSSSVQSASGVSFGTIPSPPATPQVMGFDSWCKIVGSASASGTVVAGCGPRSCGGTTSSSGASGTGATGAGAGSTSSAGSGGNGAAGASSS